MDFMDERDMWAEDHGYYHWKCRDCGMSGWTDTTPDCFCRVPEETYSEEGIDILERVYDYIADQHMGFEKYTACCLILQGCINSLAAERD